VDCVARFVEDSHERGPGVVLGKKLEPSNSDYGCHPKLQSAQGDELAVQ
jgi:hypothetical protein